MSNNDQQGGSAFPSHGTMGEVVSDGMSLRDYFAAVALGGWLAGLTDTTIHEEAIARRTYLIADAMLRVRQS